ncbi:MAG: hypothetical protein LBF57_00800 [Holosporaceae bacterium]|jgi:hypothetical protein|nr:hypothetical protein [Holosporaceae bacterium]
MKKLITTGIIIGSILGADVTFAGFLSSGPSEKYLTQFRTVLGKDVKFLTIVKKIITQKYAILIDDVIPLAINIQKNYYPISKSLAKIEECKKALNREKKEIIDYIDLILNGKTADLIKQPIPNIYKEINTLITTVFDNILSQTRTRKKENARLDWNDNYVKASPPKDAPANWKRDTSYAQISSLAEAIRLITQSSKKVNLNDTTEADSKDGSHEILSFFLALNNAEEKIETNLNKQNADIEHLMGKLGKLGKLSTPTKENDEGELSENEEPTISTSKVNSPRFKTFAEYNEDYKNPQYSDARERAQKNFGTYKDAQQRRRRNDE